MSEDETPYQGNGGEDPPEDLTTIAKLQGVVNFLFTILDDFDTIDDLAKSDHDLYRECVRETHKRRFEIPTTDEGGPDFDKIQGDGILSPESKSQVVRIHHDCEIERLSRAVRYIWTATTLIRAKLQDAESNNAESRIYATGILESLLKLPTIDGWKIDIDALRNIEIVSSFMSEDINPDDIDPEMLKQRS